MANSSLSEAQHRQQLTRPEQPARDDHEDGPERCLRQVVRQRGRDQNHDEDHGGRHQAGDLRAPPRRRRDLRARRARVDGERAAQAGHGAAGPDDDKIAVQVVGRRRGGGPTLDDRGLHDAHECDCERWCDQVTEVGAAGAVHPQRREPTPHRSQHVHAVLTQPENRHAHDRAHHPPAAPQESGGPPAARARPPAGPRRR